MENFLKKQAKKEVEAVHRVWKGYLKIVIVFWGVIGIYLIFSPGWPLGIIFVLAAIYVWMRTKTKTPLKQLPQLGKVEQTKSKFIGRHEQAYSVKKFLGEEIPNLELQIAINKDKSERSEIIDKLLKIEDYINSDLFTNRFAVESTNKDIDKLTDEGYKNCVLKNDTNLEDRCLKILDETIEFMQNFARKNSNLDGEKIADSLNSIRALTITGGTVSYISLGGLLNEDQQIAWIIMNSLFYSNKLVRDASSLLPPEPAKEQTIKIKQFADKLLNEKKIDSNDLIKIDEEIKEGLSFNKEFYESKS